MSVGIGVRVWPYLGKGDGDSVSRGASFELGLGKGVEAFRDIRLKDHGYSGVVTVRGEDWLDLRTIRPNEYTASFILGMVAAVVVPTSGGLRLVSQRLYND